MPAASLTNKTLKQMVQTFAPSDWVVNTINVPTEAKSYEWEGENTATERINSIANLFGCEVYYSFTIERLQVTEKIINIIDKRGNQVAIPQLRLNRDINKIVTTKSIEELATAYQVTGGIPDSKSDPINLVGYSYSYTDPVTGDKYTVDTATGQMRNTSAMARWSSALDTDGLIVKQYSFDTTDKATLAGQARAELQKHCNEIVNYEVDFVQLPEGAKIGDRINIIDEEGQLFLEARLLRVETMVSDGRQKATIGETLIKKSGIVQQVQQLASQFAEVAQNRKFFTWVVYANNSEGDGIALDPVGKSYMGLLVNQPEELTTVQQAVDKKTQFKWSPYQNCSVFLESTEGTTFKNKAIDTQIRAVVYRGTTRITNVTELKSMLGADAEIKWYELLYGVYLPINDSRVIDNGFALVVNSDADSLTYKCEVHS